MDALVMTVVLRALRDTLQGARLAAAEAEGAWRYRLRFEARGRSRSLVLVLDPQGPWFGPPRRPRREFSPVQDAWTALLHERFVGADLSAVSRAGEDRVVALRFGGAGALYVELRPQAPNAVAVDADGRILGWVREHGRDRSRLEPGRPYRAPARPEDALPVWSSAAEEIDARLEGLREAYPDRSAGRLLQSVLHGLSAETAELVAHEAEQQGTSPGRVFVARRKAVLSGAVLPAVGCAESPLDAVRAGRLGSAELKLWPWSPAGAETIWQGRDAADTAGTFFEARDLARELEARKRELEKRLSQEIRKVERAMARAGEDLRKLGDPRELRRSGEALLAGLARAERRDGFVEVPDPYAPGRNLRIPDEPALPLPALGERYFERARKAERGRARVEGRAQQLRQRLERLQLLRERHAGARGLAALGAFEQALAEAGLPVEWWSTKAGAATTRARAHGESGVRVFLSPEGFRVLVGRSGRANARLTFRIASPWDFWFHAAGVAGAHVIVRNPNRLRELPPGTLRFAAQLAAWFSDARGEGEVDVHWCQRRHVRPLRGAPPGTVRLKRARTIRAVPARPDEGQAGSRPAPACER